MNQDLMERIDHIVNQLDDLRSLTWINDRKSLKKLKK